MLRPEWHLGDELDREPRRVLCGLDRRQARLLSGSIAFAAALAKSQDHRALCGVFAFGQPDAVRRWSDLGYAATRASQSSEGGRILRARWLKESEVVRCDGMAPKGNSSKHRAKPVLVR